MSFKFNADEILQMAEQIERNGVKFYRKAAENMSDLDIQRMLLEFADMEVEHAQTFANIRNQFLERKQQLAAFDPEGQAGQYLQAMADGRVFDPTKDLSQQLSGDETVEDILNMAIGAEKNSIVFYLGLKDMVPEDEGRDDVEAIIREEMQHIIILNHKFGS